ncbi:hypothetical protein QJQ45_003087 [Haematococcus lacustris]|nr:hypothetical protein QJQ45_003087 [Haematococcus lacustris]
MSVASLVLALSLAILAWSAFAADPGWQEGRGTWFDVQDGDLRTANCHFRWDQVRTGKYIGAFSDTNPMFRGSCGKCIELRCQNADFKDGFGQTLDRKNACKDPKRSIFVTIADACPCHYPSNHHSNKRWCCGDSSRTHIDVTQEAFAQLADLGHGRWLALIKPHLQHLAAASSAGTSLVANLKHITVTLATWDMVWEVYLDPKWAIRWLRLCGAQDRALEQFFKQEVAELSMERHGRAKQLVVFFGTAGIGTRGGWGGDAVLRACCKVLCRPRGSNKLRGRVVLVDEHRTTRVSSAVNGKQSWEGELNHEQPTRRAGWKPPAGQGEPRLLRPAWSQQRDQPVRGLMWCPRIKAEPAAEPTKGTGKAQGKAAKAKPAQQPGRWLDRDCNAALNMQRIGESRWRPLDLCYWPEQGALPAKGKEYPEHGYKRLRDKPPKTQQQQQPAAAQQSSLVLALSLAILAWSAFAADPGWQEGRGTWFDVQDGDLRTANCHFRWDQVRTGKYIGAFSDTNPMFREQLHQCLQALQQSENEVLAVQVSLHRSKAELSAAKEELAACMSKNADFKDGFGQTLDRKNACKDPKRSIFVTIADACPCHYPSNHHSNKRWCCGDSSRTHIDVTQEAFAQLADLGHGRWLALIKPHLQHLAAASSAGTSLVANLKHITVTLATWDMVWEVYLDPKWAIRWLRLCGAQDWALEQFFKQEVAELSMERHGRAKQLVVFFGTAGIGTRGGWGADAVLRACCKVLCRPRGSNKLRGRVVLVDEHRTTRVSSAVNGKQSWEGELNHEQPTMCAGWKPPAGQGEPRLLRPAWSQQRDQPVRGLMWCPRIKAEPAAEPTKGTGKAQGKAAKAKPAQQPGRWLDRDGNAALIMQRIGESRWRPLDLCYWPEQGALPAKGKEYPEHGYKRLRDKPPKTQQQQQPAAAQQSSLVLALSLAILAWSAFAADPGWQEGRGTWFDVQDGDLRTANCHFRWDQVRTGKYIGAFSDTNPMFRGSCGKCIELRCQNADFKDGFGQTLDRKNACKDPKRSIFVTIADACPCHYPSNHHSNKRWCCGDSSRTHIDVTQEAFAQLADLGHGRWLALIKPHLQHLAAASSAGTSLVANLKHITVTLATWDMVWEVYLDPKWAIRWLRLCGAQDWALEQFFKQEVAELSMERHGRAKQLVVFFGTAGIGTRGGWGADAVLRACCKVLCRPRGSNKLRGRVVLVDEHRTTRVSSAVNGKQSWEGELNHEQPTMCAGWKPPAGQGEPRLLRPAWSQQRDQPVRGLMWCPRIKAEPAAEPTKGTGKAQGKAAKAKPAQQPGRWLDRDGNAELIMQRIGESRWRPLDLCYWPEQGALPAKGKEYPEHGYKRLRDKPPKTQQQQQPAAAQQSSLVLALSLAILAWSAFAADPGWQEGRGTWFDVQDGDLRTANCHFRWDQVRTGKYIGAFSDTNPMFRGSCGKCIELRCQNADFKDGFGQTLDRKNACKDPKRSIFVTIADACPCHYPSNHHSNKRWCCGDSSRTHIDVTQEAFAQLADLGHGVIALQWRLVDCKTVSSGTGHYYPSGSSSSPSKWTSL